MDERQKDLSNYRITEADDSLKVAAHCLKEGLYKDSINRSYYAAFYAVKAVLALSTVDFKSNILYHTSGGKTVYHRSGIVKDNGMSLTVKNTSESFIRHVKAFINILTVNSNIIAEDKITVFGSTT